MADLLTPAAISEVLERNAGWELVSSSLERTFTFSSFDDAMDFVNGIAAIARSTNHHPDIDIRYSSVRVATTTHDAGGLTSLDVDLVRAVDNLL